MLELTWTRRLSHTPPKSGAIEKSWKTWKSETKCSCTEILFLVDYYILSDLSKRRLFDDKKKKNQINRRIKPVHHIWSEALWQALQAWTVSDPLWPSWSSFVPVSLWRLSRSHQLLRWLEPNSHTCTHTSQFSHCQGTACKKVTCHWFRQQNF